jgi:hypothetical protein
MQSWMGPPENVLPGIVSLELVLVHTDRQVIWIGEAEVYREGIAFSVLMCGREPARDGVESGSGTWRFGVQFSDGGKATVHGVGMFSAGTAGGVRTIGARAAASGSQPPDRPVLRARGGGGSRSAWRQQYWLWPLPPPGNVLFACQWPDLGIEFTTATVNADTFWDAAERSRRMWPNPGQPDL